MANTHKTHKEMWMNNLETFRKYVNEFGKFPRYNTVYEGVNLGYWYNKQKYKFRHGKLSEDRINTLNEVSPFWNASIDERAKEEEILQSIISEDISNESNEESKEENIDLNSVDIRELNLSNQIYLILRRKNIDTVQDLINMEKSGNLYKIRGLGPVRLNEILDKINNLDCYISKNCTDEKDDMIEEENIKLDHSQDRELIPGVIYDNEEDDGVEYKFEFPVGDDINNPTESVDEFVSDFIEEENYPEDKMTINENPNNEDNVYIDEGPALHKYFVSFTFTEGLKKKRQFGNGFITLDYKINSGETLLKATEMIKDKRGRRRNLTIISFNEI